MPRLVQPTLPLSVDEAVAAVYATWSEEMLLNNVRNMAKTCGLLCYHTKFSLKSDAGFPDLCITGNGRLLFAELKRQGKWPTEGHFSKGLIPRWIKGQREWLTELAATATETYIWWPSDVADIATILTQGPHGGMDCVRRMKEYLQGGGG